MVLTFNQLVISPAGEDKIDVYFIYNNKEYELITSDDTTEEDLVKLLIKHFELS